MTNSPTNVVFNCSVPFYVNFRQHLECNLETECVHAEDEVNCPYARGVCELGFLNAGSKCYKYVKTRKRMTWYDAVRVCQNHGLTLASFPILEQERMFREDILQFAPIVFKVFIGLRTSDQLLPTMYREVWQWSSGAMAYYAHIEEEHMFKPRCTLFPALLRDKISTTPCEIDEYMQYIFCEAELSVMQNISRKINLPLTYATSTIHRKENMRFSTCSEGQITHDFLSCLHLSRCGAKDRMTTCVTNSSINSDTVERNVEVRMFTCDSQTQTIHYTQVCDHQAQCLDSSDEAFCIHQQCVEKQCLNQQCVKAAQWCDGVAHCSDGSDEACPQFVTQSPAVPSAASPGYQVVVFNGYGNYQFHSQEKEILACPTTHFPCASHQLCLPVYLRCNGVYDCADHEDEDCLDFICPGFFRCQASTICVHFDHICDGVFQCPQGDDELMCQLTCPEECQCQGLAFVCPRTFSVQNYTDLRYLDAHKSGLTPDQLAHNHYLIRLALRDCRLRTLPVLKFPNIKFLDLGNNILSNISIRVFLNMSNLKFLSLSGNPLVSLGASESNTFLKTCHSLDLSFTNLNYFESSAFWNMRNLRSLNMSHSTIKVISTNGFGSLLQLEYLDLRGTEITDYPIETLKPLSSLQEVFSDIYKLCCREILPEQLSAKNCHTSPDEIASCKDLLRSGIYRMFLWVSCCFSLIGNGASFAIRLSVQKGKPQNSFNVFISHLNVADFIMGLYLVVVGAADQVYRGTYLWHDKAWKTCVWCKIAGFISLFSSEMSAFIICLITVDRFLVMHFPFSQLRFRNTSAGVACGICWAVSFSLAALPLLPVMSDWEFYSQTGICIPLPVTRRNFEGRPYSFAIMVVFNFILFVVIASGQAFIFLSIRRNSMTMDQNNTREATVARRLLTVVMSDLLCWFPIGLFGLLASNDVPIPGEIIVAMAIFALPLNSALNPFLYTFNLLMEKRQKAAEQRLLKILQKSACSSRECTHKCA